MKKKGPRQIHRVWEGEISRVNFMLDSCTLFGTLLIVLPATPASSQEKGGKKLRVQALHLLRKLLQEKKNKKNPKGEQNHRSRGTDDEREACNLQRCPTTQFSQSGTCSAVFLPSPLCPHPPTMIHLPIVVVKLVELHTSSDPLEHAENAEDADRVTLGPVSTCCGFVTFGDRERSFCFNGIG